MAPDFHETRPRNYVLSASASAVRRQLDSTELYFTQLDMYNHHFKITMS